MRERRGEERRGNQRADKGVGEIGSDRARGCLSYMGILLMRMHVCDGEMLMREE